jgi:hypothetical protein
MLGVYASVAAILVASLVLGRTALCLLGLRIHTWLAGVVGFALLIVVCPLLIRLPGRGTTLVAVIAVITIAAIVYLSRLGDAGRGRPDWKVAAAVGMIVVAAASLPFAVNGHDGVLGEGIYTKDQAAQLYWTDWMQHGVGSEPGAVRFGYPTGPQSIAAAAAEGTHTTLLNSFNGLLLAIPVLTALTALVALEALPAGRRVVAASLTALPYLGASFLAQSAFKETAMALLLLGFAVALQRLTLSVRGLTSGEGPHPRRTIIVVLILIAAASVFVYSIPGLVWFALALPIWLALGLATHAFRLDFAALSDALGRHRRVLLVGVILLVGVAAFSAAQLYGFVGHLGKVETSTGRLSSPIFPGEALGIWPAGDFRVQSGDVFGAYPAAFLGLIAAAIGAVAAYLRRDVGLLAVMLGTTIVYIGARLVASIHVEAKALAVASPLFVLAALLALLGPSWGEANGRDSRRKAADGKDRLTPARYAFGGLVAMALAASTFLALRAAPIGFDERGKELESIAGLIHERPVAFLGVDRFAGYWLRGTLVKSPGGNVPFPVPARAKKSWEQGQSMDFDTLSTDRLNQFDYAITTRAAYQSTPPLNFKPVERTDSFTLWKRMGHTARLGIIDKPGTPGRVLHCSSGHGRGVADRGGMATVLHRPVVGGPASWSKPRPVDAPATATQRLRLSRGLWKLSLQYDSQVPLAISAGGRSIALPPSLDGMYLKHHGQGAFWAAGTVHSKGGIVVVTVSAQTPTTLQDALGARRQVWLGAVAATRPGSRMVPLRDTCGRFVDHWRTRAAAPGT